ncbi:serine/threonine protein kinase [Candidatus Micrarchaeota archaeon]|nr:serine/threonine protein kinase [Candidatus Micrarchaeota archaeon]
MTTRYLEWPRGLQELKIGPGINVYTWSKYKHLFDASIWKSQDALESATEETLRRMKRAHPESAKRIEELIKAKKKPLTGQHFFVLEDHHGGHILIKKAFQTTGMRRPLSEFLTSARWNDISPEHGVEPIGMVQHGSHHYLVYQFQHGFMPLNEYRERVEWQKRDPSWKTERRTFMATLAGMALGKAHNAGISHGDLHPENILVRIGQDHLPVELKLIDWEWTLPRTGAKSVALASELRKLWTEFKRPPTEEETLAFMRAYDAITGRKMTAAYQKVRQRRSRTLQ